MFFPASNIILASHSTDDFDVHRPAERAAQEDGVPVYNYVSSVQNRLTWDSFMYMTSKWGVRVPSSRSIWIYSLTLCKYKTMHLLLTALLHFLPALFVDAVCIAIGNPFR